MKTTYVFLDIDGVLNNINYLTSNIDNDNPINEISPYNLKIFKDFISIIPNYKIILSSSWQLSTILNAAIEKKLESINLKISGRTLDYSDNKFNFSKEQSIIQWLKINEINKEQIIILDDEPVEGDLKDRLVQTDVNKGLVYADVVKALRELNII